MPAELFDDKQADAERAILNNEDVSGHYKKNNRLERYPEVWGKRAKWMQLAGLVNGDSISVCIFDSPNNINHPLHWMTRDYGLYAVNPFGSNIYTEGKSSLIIRLKKGSLQLLNIRWLLLMENILNLKKLKCFMKI